MPGKDFRSGNESFIDDTGMANIKLHRAESMVENDKVVQEKAKNQIDRRPSIIDSGSVLARSFCSEINYLKTEVIMFMYMFSFVITRVTNTTLIMDKVCLVHLGRSEYECAHLQNDSLKNLKIEVTEMANNYHVGQSLISMLPAALLSPFIGSWSDRYSRKVPMVAILIGTIIYSFGETLCAYFYETRVEYMFIPAAFAGISGGFIGVILVLYAYASDLSHLGNRTLRFALLEMAFGLSMPLGGLAGGWIFKFFGFVPVFLTSLSGHVFGLLWVLFVLDETKGLDNRDSWATKIRSFWTTELLLSAFRATAKKRPNRGREQIWALILALSISVFAFASTASIGFLYVHHVYDWDNTVYSTVNSVLSVMGIVVMLIVVPLSKRFKVPDVVLGMVGSASLTAKMICTGLAMDPSLYYLAGILGLFTGLGTLAGRSKISKITPKEDLGKVFAFLSTAESILPIAATAVISQGFNASLRFFPGLVYVVMGTLSIIPALIFFWISRIPNANVDSKPEKQVPAEAVSPSESNQEVECSTKF